MAAVAEQIFNYLIFKWTVYGLSQLYEWCMEFIDSVWAEVESWDLFGDEGARNLFLAITDLFKEWMEEY